MQGPKELRCRYVRSSATQVKGKRVALGFIVRLVRIEEIERMQKMKKPYGALLLVLVVLFCSASARAQAGAGYTKLNTAPVSITTFTSAALTPGVYAFEVTAVNAAGVESGPSNIVIATVTAAAPHAVLAWTASIVDPTHGSAISYNVYDLVIQKSNAPGNVTITFTP
jgi:predicted phage tail protein